MTDGYQDGPEPTEAALQQALLRLTSPRAQELQYELDCLRLEIESLQKLEGDHSTELHEHLQTTTQIVDRLEETLRQLGEELRDPVSIEQRLDRTVLPALHKQVTEREDDVAEVLAPVMGPAIRRQIRDAKEDIIDALYPLIGQIIGKAISEALRELTRNIDTRLRQQLNFQDRLSHTLARLRGVSEAELMIREALPYVVERVFLVHRETGLLLAHVAAQGDDSGQLDTISGMLTAIQDFVRDSFSGGEGDLEEITHGGRRILLEGGQRAYVAVVLTGVEPVGYNDRIRQVNGEINVRYENELKRFEGEMDGLPDFKPLLAPLLAPQIASAVPAEPSQPLSRAQRRVVGWSLAGLLLLTAALIFGCIFVARLWPLAFAPAPVFTPTVLPSSTPTPTPTQMPTATITALPTSTATPVPTLTATLPPSVTPPAVGLLTGNLNVRREPAMQAAVVGVIPAGEEVIVLDSRDGWYHVRWPAQGAPQLEGWVWGSYLLLPTVSSS
jgi:ubiquinone biosynthesis protein UbiJ